MASQFSRRDFLPAGLRADRVELVGNTVRIHTRAANAVCARHAPNQSGLLLRRPLAGFYSAVDRLP